MKNSTLKPPGKIVFSALFIGFFAYTILYAAGNLLKNNALNFVGAACFFAIVLLSNIRRIRSSFRLDKITMMGLIMIIFPSLLTCYGLFTDDWAVDARDFFKHVGLVLFFLLFRTLQIPPPYLFPNRYKYIYVFTLVIVISFIMPESQVLEDSRLSGFGVNPNSFILSILPLLFFISPNDKKLKMLCHFSVIIALFKSKTLGAILGYVAGLLYLTVMSFRKINKVYKKKRMRVLASGLFVVALVLCYIQVSDNTVSVRVRNQLELFEASGYDALRGVRLDYGYLVQKYGTSSGLSGIWRLSHWSQIMTGIQQSSLFHQLCGQGFRYSDIRYGNMPHNEYLRYFLEQGALGLFLLILLFTHIYKSVPHNIRYIYVMFFVFNFTENNISNLYAVTLFMLAASSSEGNSHKKRLELKVN